MWHVSISPRFPLVVNRARRLFEVADDELAQVGDATLGKWQEVSGVAVHVRRRLTVDETTSAGIVEVCDIRGTAEFAQRIQQMRPFLPAPLRDLPPEAYQ